MELAMTEIKKAAVIFLFAIMLGGCETTSERNQRLNVAAEERNREQVLMSTIRRQMDNKEISLVSGYTQMSHLRKCNTGREERLLCNFYVSAAYQADLDGLTRDEFERRIDPQVELYFQQLRLGMRGSGSSIPVLIPTPSMNTTSQPARRPSTTTCNNVGGIISCSTF
jgi:hypothetical protein